MTDPTDPDLVFDLDTVRVVAASAPEPCGVMLNSMADALESLRERYRMAEVIADVARLKIRADDTPMPLKAGDKMPLILAWVCRTLAACLEAKGAPNYFGWGWTDEETGKSYRVRVQHDTGKSPEEVAAEARDARDEALAALANERGEGEGPSEGWRVSSLLAARWVYQPNMIVLANVTAPGLADDDRYWAWRIYASGQNLARTGTAPTAREAMRAADLARGEK